MNKFSVDYSDTDSVEPPSPSATTPSSPALRPSSQCSQFQTSTPNSVNKRHSNPPLNVVLPSVAPPTPPAFGEPALTPPPRSPGAPGPASGDGRHHAPDGTSSDKSSETAVAGVSRPTSTALSRKESYKAQRQHYRREKKRATSALLNSIEDPAVVVLADWLKVRGSLKSWTKLWCVLKPGLLLLYKTPKAKSSHWVGTVLLTSCQVIERPSKKDGFCFKLYHPLEQSIWAPRGPHNETIGAVVQPLPTAHLIFRAPSQAAGHCWLDGLELALRCSNAMLRCSRSRPEQTVVADAPATQTNISHEELEKHFNEHVTLYEMLSRAPTPLMSVEDYTPRRFGSGGTESPPATRKTPKAPRKTSKWAQFVESFEILRDHDASTDSQTPCDDKKDGGLLDFLRRRESWSERASPCLKIFWETADAAQRCKSLASSPMRTEAAKRTALLKRMEIPKAPVSLGDKKCVGAKVDAADDATDDVPVKRRSSTPANVKSSLTKKHASSLKESGSKTDSENDEASKIMARSKGKAVEVLCDTSENILITKTAPSVERFREYSSSSSESETRVRYPSPYNRETDTPDKSLIDYQKLPPATLYREDRSSFRNVYVAGKIVSSELAGAASDTDSDASRGGMPDGPRDERARRDRDVLARIEDVYVEDPDRETGAAGELVEEVAEENKSLLWFLLKQVRPGMDLSKVVLPTFILEPRSFLDKLSDNYYHADILAQAQSTEDPYQRFRCVLRWYLSGLYRKPRGLKKPYNPVLGETFRCCWRHPDTDTHTYYIAEQVSHHPPVSAFYVSNRKEGFVISGSLLARSKFYGNSTSAILEGCARVHLLPWGETYVTTAPYAHCKGIVIGTLSMELGGKVQVMCAETGYHADVEFKLRSFLSGADQTNAISGRIKKGKETIATVDGYWDGRIDIKDKRTGEESNLLDVSVLKEQRLPRFLVRLDHQREHESQRLWLKVSEAIQNDDQLAATEQKTIIEEAQRARARSLAAPWVPRLFHRDLHALPPDGIVDQGWNYNHLNTSPWQPDEVIEYEEDFVIRSVSRAGPAAAGAAGGGGGAGVGGGAGGAAGRGPAPRASDSDSHDDLARRSKSSTRTLKQSLFAIDTALRDQSIAIERILKTVETISDGQRATVAAIRPQNMGRMPQTYSSWDLFGGIVIAMVLQALLNWIFYQKD